MAFYHTMCFVFTVLVICNAILYPTLFSGFFKKWFESETREEQKEKLPDVPPQMRSGQRMPGSMRHTEMENAAQRNMMKHSADPASYFAQQKQEASKGRGVMGSVLPVYAVGIVIYFAYIMYRIFLKDDKSRSPDASTTVFGGNNQATVHRLQEEQLQRQLSEQLRAENYTGIKAKPPAKGTKASSRRSTGSSENDSPDLDEMAVLKKRLAETENSMQRMMDMMNNMGIAMSQVTEQLTGTSTGLPSPRSEFTPGDNSDGRSEDYQGSCEEEDQESDFDSDGDPGAGAPYGSENEEGDNREEEEEAGSDDDDGGEGTVEDINGCEPVVQYDSVRRRVNVPVGGERES